MQASAGWLSGLPSCEARGTGSWGVGANTSAVIRQQIKPSLLPGLWQHSRPNSWDSPRHGPVEGGEALRQSLTAT